VKPATLWARTLLSSIARPGAITIGFETWRTNGQVERMNRTLKEATVRRYHYDSHHQLRQHIQTFLDAYNFAKRLKTLHGLTPFESVCKGWTKESNRFKYDPVQLTSGLHI
jgi:hypothetical protein